MTNLNKLFVNRLQQALEELRGVYDKQMEQNREDFAKLYDDRVSITSHPCNSQISNVNPSVFNFSCRCATCRRS